MLLNRFSFLQRSTAAVAGIELQFCGVSFLNRSTHAPARRQTNSTRTINRLASTNQRANQHHQILPHHCPFSIQRRQYNHNTTPPRSSIEFWFDFPSHYSYLSMSRLPQLLATQQQQQQHPIDVTYRPFLLGPVFQALGQASASTSPFIVQKEKGAYVWKDIARECEKYEIPWQQPTVFPRRALLPIRVALYGTRINAPWLVPFCQKIYEANFVHDLEIDSPATVTKVLESLQLDPKAIIAAATTEENKTALRAQTDEAIRRGIFGAPMFFVRNPLVDDVNAEPQQFWGQDRLQDAIEWATRTTKRTQKQPSTRLNSSTSSLPTTQSRSFSTAAPRASPPTASAPASPSASPPSSFNILILGGYGLFGSRIASGLLTTVTSNNKTPINVYMNARNAHRKDHEEIERRVERIRKELENEKSDQTGATSSSSSQLHASIFSASDLPTLRSHLTSLRIHLVINCVGPFQTASYQIPRACAEMGVNYLDLSDGRDYVCDFQSALNTLAQQHHVTLITGASSLPGLSSAVIDHLRSLGQMKQITSIQSAISPGNHTPRGHATMASILTQVGQRLMIRTPMNTHPHPIRIWSWSNNIRAKEGFFHPRVKSQRRWLSMIDVPDLGLFPTLYASKDNPQQQPTIEFRAGLENQLMHISLIFFSFLVRFGVIRDLAAHTSLFKRISELSFLRNSGSDTGGMSVLVKGLTEKGEKVAYLWRMYAGNGHGVHVPATAAVTLCEKLIRQWEAEKQKQPPQLESASLPLSSSSSPSAPLLNGAYPCCQLFTLDEFFRHLRILNVSYEIVKLDEKQQ